ncbi:hypothetical protein EMCRGX_G010540 [Ephydatia muelleri]
MPDLVSDLCGLVPAMGATRVVVAVARVAAGKVVVGALVPILVPVVGLVQVVVLLLLLVAVLQLLLVVVGAALLLLLVAVGAALLLLLVAVGAALLLLVAVLLLLLAADGRGAALHLAAAWAESQQYDTHAQLKYHFLLISMH